MKYFVTLGDREIEVEVDGERVDCGRADSGGPPQHHRRHAPAPGDDRRRSLLVPLERLGPGRWSVTAWGERRDATVLDERAKQIEGLVRRAEPATQGGVIKAPMPGLVLRIPVAVGQAVARARGSWCWRR
jgi:biotin carboxyl carrier protein